MSKKPLTFLILLFLISASAMGQCYSADAGQDKYICPGQSTIIGTSARPGLSYYWTPTTGLNNPYIAQPTVTTSTNATYTLHTKSNNLIINGDFESGFSSFGTDYNIYPNGPCGAYSVGSLTVSDENHSSLNRLWCNFFNHTPNGRLMLVVDGHCQPNMRVWHQTVQVSANTTYNFSGWAVTQAGPSPTLRVRVNGVDILTNQMASSYVCFSNNNPQWVPFSAKWYSDASTTATIEIYDDQISMSGNDFLMDDLYFSECAESEDDVNVTLFNQNISSFESGQFNEGSEISYLNFNSQNIKCYGWESSASIILNSNYSENNSWFVNGIQVFDGYQVPSGGVVTISNNSKTMTHINPLGENNYNTVPSNELNCMPPPIYVTSIKTFYPGVSNQYNNGIGYIDRRNQTYTIDPYFFSTNITSLYGPNTHHSWSFPSGVNVTYNPNIIQNQNINITVDNNFAPTFNPISQLYYILGTVTISNSLYSCVNQTYYVYISVPHYFKSPKNENPIDQPANSNTNFLFPNPATEFLSLNKYAFPFEITLFEIYSPTGQLVKRGNISKGPAFTKVDISYLKSGGYFIKLIGDKSKSQTISFIVNKSK